MRWRPSAVSRALRAELEAARREQAVLRAELEAAREELDAARAGRDRALATPGLLDALRVDELLELEIGLTQALARVRAAVLERSSDIIAVEETDGQRAAQLQAPLAVSVVDDVSDALATPWPLHVAVWDDDVVQLRALARAATTEQLEATDPRGHTPLMLAVRMQRVDAARALIAAGASPLAKDPRGWVPLQEAAWMAGADALLEEMLRAQLARAYRDFERRRPALMAALADVPDFEAELKWEVSARPPQTQRDRDTARRRARRRRTTPPSLRDVAGELVGTARQPAAPMRRDHYTQARFGAAHRLPPRFVRGSALGVGKGALLAAAATDWRGAERTPPPPPRAPRA